MTYVLWGWFALAIIAVALWLGGNALHRRSRGRFGFAVDQFYEARMAQGMSGDQATDLLTMQRELALTRRLASDRVVACPAAWLVILDEEKAAAVKRLSYRRDLARRLGETLGGLPYNHVLYADACEAVEAILPLPAAFVPTEDDMAALTLSRPS